MPAAAVAVVPQEHVSTAEARAALPTEVPLADAAYSAAHAALLGAAISSGDARLFAAATDDRLHEPYRGVHAPHLAAIRENLPLGALGATLSGSGPTVIVWVEREFAPAVAVELATRYPEHEIYHLAVAATGAGPT
jgi:homoserine kinase